VIPRASSARTAGSDTPSAAKVVNIGELLLAAAVAALAVGRFD
jgi:hypothetical protein